MKKIIAASAVVVALMASTAMAEELTSSRTTTIQNSDGSSTIITREKTVPVIVDHSTELTSAPGTLKSKRVEREYTDPDGNTSKVVVNKTTDASGRQVNSRYEETSGQSGY